LYYGKNPLTERTSLPVTELAVELLQSAAPKEFGKIDTQLAASISRKACISPCSLMLGLIYVDRLRQKSPEYLQQVSSADLFLVAMMVASKFLYDDGEDGVYNDEWAESAGLGTETVNALERDFLKAIDWNLLARGKEFEKKLEQLERSVALRKGKERLWKLSYTDLWVFLRNLECLHLLKANVNECLKIFGAAISAYVLGIAVLWVSLSTASTIRSKMNQEKLNSNTMTASFSESDIDLLADCHENSTHTSDQIAKSIENDFSPSEPGFVAPHDRRHPFHAPGRMTRCKRWTTFFLTMEMRCRALRRDAAMKMERGAVLPLSNCGENATCRNVKIQNNGFNFSFAQERINNSWADAGIEKIARDWASRPTDRPIGVYG